RLGPALVLGAVGEALALTSHLAPHRAHKVEVVLAGALRPLARDDAGAAQRVVRVAERQTGDVGEAALVPLDQPSSLALDRVPTGLALRLTAADVALDLAGRERAHRHARAHAESQTAAGRRVDDDLGPHLVRLPRERREHRERFAIAARLSEPLALELDLGVRRERRTAAARDRVGLRRRG